MEECVECTLRCSPLLDIIHNQYINGLVKVDEIVGAVLAHGICKLNLKESSTYIEYALAWIDLFATYADGIDEMCFSTSRWTIDEEGIEGALSWMFCYRHSYGSWQFVAGTLQVVLESLADVELGIEVCHRCALLCGRWGIGRCGVDRCACHVPWLGFDAVWDGRRTVCFYLLGDIVGFVHHYTIT